MDDARLTFLVRKHDLDTNCRQHSSMLARRSKEAMARDFGDELGRRLHAQHLHAQHLHALHRPVLRARTLRNIEGIVTGVDDPVLRHLAAAIAPSFARSAEANRLFIEAVTTAVAVHLATTYGHMRTEQPGPAGGLAPWQMRRACDLIDIPLVIVSVRFF